MLGVVGTLIAFTWVAPLTYFFNQFNFFYLSYSKYDYASLIKMGGVPIDPVTKQRLNISELNLTYSGKVNSTMMNILDNNNYSTPITNIIFQEKQEENETLPFNL